MNHYSLKVGNIVRYVGKLQNHYDRIGQILSIDEIEHKRYSFLLKVKDYAKKVYEIIAYENELWPVTVDISHLNALGFINNSNVFSLENIILIRPQFFYPTEKPPRYVDKGFISVEATLAIPIKESDVDKIATPVGSMHALQNYLENKNLVKIIDWSIFL